LAAILQLQPVQDIIRQMREDYITGRKGYGVEVKLACLLVMHLQNIPCVTRLIAFLRSHREMRDACGIASISDVPSEDAIYRFRKRLIEFGYHHELVQALVSVAHHENPDMGKDVAVDSTDVDAWCNKYRKRGEHRDRDADWGKRRDAFGEYKEDYLGYRLHLMTCADTELPLAWTVTAANSHDSTQAIPVFNKAREQHEWFSPEHGLMDKGYDTVNIHASLEKDFQCHPIIPLKDMQKVGGQLLDKQGRPFCEAGAWKWMGTDYKRKRSKWACPMTCDNPAGCAGRKGPKTCYLNLKDDYRKHSLVPRDTEKFWTLYNKRGAVEREFSRLKDQYMLGSLRVQGMEKVTLHFELALITRLAVHLISNTC